MGMRLGVCLISMAVALSASCRDETSQKGAGGFGGAGGEGGGGGCPDDMPQPVFDLNLRAAKGPLPSDLQLTVKWSAGEEPLFALDDPTTYSTLETANFLCDVDASNPPPTQLEFLRCQLWTPGATEITVTASGYATHMETLTPMKLEDCDQLTTKSITVEIEPESER